MKRRFGNESTSVILGNAVEVLETEIPDASVDLFFADPPYNIGKRLANFVDRWPSEEEYLRWIETWLEVCLRKLTPTGSLYVMASTQCMPHIDLFLRTRLHILSRIVWHYDSSGVQARRYFGSMYEPILHCVRDPKQYTFNADEIQVEARTGATRKLIDYRKPKPTVYNSSKVPGNVWSFPRVRYRMPEYEEHPTQKPEALLERIVRASSNKGDLVVDPFAGTFTTCAVAQRLGRRTIGIELQEEFVKIGLRRLGLAKTYGKERLHPPRKNFKHRSPEGQTPLFD